MTEETKVKTIVCASVSSTYLEYSCILLSTIEHLRLELVIFQLGVNFIQIDGAKSRFSKVLKDFSFLHAISRVINSYELTMLF